MANFIQNLGLIVVALAIVIIGWIGETQWALGLLTLSLPIIGLMAFAIILTGKGISPYDKLFIGLIGLSAFVVGATTFASMAFKDQSLLLLKQAGLAIAGLIAVYNILAFLLKWRGGKE